MLSSVAAVLNRSVRWIARSEFFFQYLLVIIVLQHVVLVQCLKKSATSSSSIRDHESIIEDVTAKQLEKILNDKDFVAVYWCEFFYIIILIIIITFRHKFVKY